MRCIQVASSKSVCSHFFKLNKRLKARAYLLAGHTSRSRGQDKDKLRVGDWDDVSGVSWVGWWEVLAALRLCRMDESWEFWGQEEDQTFKKIRGKTCESAKGRRGGLWQALSIYGLQ